MLKRQMMQFQQSCRNTTCVAEISELRVFQPQPWEPLVTKNESAEHKCCFSNHTVTGVHSWICWPPSSFPPTVLGSSALLKSTSVVMMKGHPNKTARVENMASSPAGFPACKHHQLCCLNARWELQGWSTKVLLCHHHSCINHICADALLQHMSCYCFFKKTHVTNTKCNN